MRTRVMSDKQRCASMTHGGGRVSPCKNYPSHGDTRCRAHGGESRTWPEAEANVGLSAATGEVVRLLHERDEARAEVERLRSRPVRLAWEPEPHQYGGPTYVDVVINGQPTVRIEWINGAPFLSARRLDRPNETSDG